MFKETKDFWIDVADRALKTYFQFFLTVITAGSHYGISLAACFALSGLASFLSVATSIVSTKRGDPNSASLLR